MNRSRSIRRVPKKQSLDDLHQAIKKFMLDDAPSILSRFQESPQTFEDALQAIEVASRPQDEPNIKLLGEALLSAVAAAGDNPQDWKMLALTIIRKRFHSKAPEAQACKAAMKDTKTDDSNSDELSISFRSSGHGERLSFYLMIVYFQSIAQIEGVARDLAQKSFEYLTNQALLAGGTRDVCTLIEHLMYYELDQAGILQIREDEGNKRALCQAIIDFLRINDMTVSPVLSQLIKTVSNMLDEDFSLINADNDVPNGTCLPEQNSSKDEKVSFKISKEGKLQSTINTFIPHHNRGNKSRKLVQSVAELMIWSHTLSAKADTKFSLAFADITNIMSTSDADDKIIAGVHTMQTSIRRLRKKLNASSREQGFSLCSSFEMDPKSITLGKVRTAKEGDVARLNERASKARDRFVMSIISNRYSDPSKAIPIDSMTSLKRQWLRIKTKNDSGEEIDELTSLKLQIQEATVKATINLLRSKIPESSEDNSSKIIVASLDQSAEGDGAAILVAAAHDARCLLEDNNGSCEHSVSLYIGEEDFDISNLSLVMEHLDTAFTKERLPTVSNDEPATTKDIQNLIERHVKPTENLLLFASSDVKLEPRVLTNLKEQKCSIHCHVLDDWAMRMEREDAKVGDITATLAWDNECDLDLHAICPNGDHIFYGERRGGELDGGGYLDVDMNMSGESKVPVENIFFGDAEKGIEATHGKYKVYVQNYAYHKTTVAKGDPVVWRLRLSIDGGNTEYTGECIGTGESSNVTAVEFEYSGRTAPAPEFVGSALKSSNLISVSSSVGDSIDSISGLMELQYQVHELNRVRNLISTSEADEQENNNTTIEQSEVVSEPLMADKNCFRFTNRDRLYLNLSRLPTVFHTEANQCFEGGQTLLDYTATSLAKRLIKDDVHIDELKQSGYPTNVIKIVKERMATFGLEGKFDA